MDEAEFRVLVANWLTGEVNAWKKEKRAKTLPDDGLERLEVVSGKQLVQGWVAWPGLDGKKSRDWHYASHSNHWISKPSKREVDVAIVLNVNVDGEEARVPLFAIELKTGGHLNTDVLNMKSEIYARLRESYASVRTALIVAEYGDHRSLDRLVVNARSFDYVFTEWSTHGDGSSRQILRDAVRNQLDYCLWYWMF